MSDAEHLYLCPRPGNVYFSVTNSLVIILTCLSAGFFTVCNFKVVYLWIVSDFQSGFKNLLVYSFLMPPTGFVSRVCACTQHAYMHECLCASGECVCVQARGQPLLSFLRKHHLWFCFQISSHQSGGCQVARLDGHRALGICLFLPPSTPVVELETGAKVHALFFSIWVPGLGFGFL